MIEWSSDVHKAANRMHKASVYSNETVVRESRNKNVKVDRSWKAQKTWMTQKNWVDAQNWEWIRKLSYLEATLDALEFLVTDNKF